MKIYGFPANYDGDFGDIPVIQAGKYKIIRVQPYQCIPFRLGVLLVKAKNTKADFLVIDPDPVLEDYPQFIDISKAA